MDDLGGLLRAWPVDEAAAAVVRAGAPVATGGDTTWVLRIASISKLLTTYACLVATEEGTLDLDEPAGRPGATVRHLLAHAAGYDFDTGRSIAEVGARRIYSNTGIEVVAEHLAARASIPFAEYLTEAVFAPLEMTQSRLPGSPAASVRSSVDDLIRFAAELLRPTLVSATTLAEATAVQFPALDGVLPGVGRFRPNPWGLGFEIRGDKSPHWTGTASSPRTFGHFGGSGTFLWVDPDIDLACVAVCDREFGPWSLEAWPPFSDEVIRRYR